LALVVIFRFVPLVDFFEHEPPPDTVPLLREEKKLRAILEPVIGSGLETALAVTLALRTVRNRRLFRNISPTFQRYLRDRFGLRPTRIVEMLSGISTVENLLLDIYPFSAEPDMADSQSGYPKLGRPRSTQVAPFRRMGRPPGHVIKSFP
jgi:hypothetical protein